MPLGPDVRIASPAPGAVFNVPGAIINVNGWAIPTPTATVTVSGWLETPAGGITPVVNATPVGSNPNVNWTLAIPTPAGGGGDSFKLTVRLIWQDASLPGGFAKCQDEVDITLAT